MLLRTGTVDRPDVLIAVPAAMTSGLMSVFGSSTISSLAIHPHDPDTAYVAALGHAWGTNPERGIYRTTNGEIGRAHV